MIVWLPVGHNEMRDCCADNVRMLQLPARVAGEDRGNVYLTGLSNWILNGQIGKEENIYTLDISVSGSCMRSLWTML